MKVAVHYECACCEGRQLVEVEERGVAEDLATWMLELQKVLSRDHRARSPSCPVKALARVEVQTVAGLLIGRVSG